MKLIIEQNESSLCPKPGVYEFYARSGSREFASDKTYHYFEGEIGDMDNDFLKSVEFKAVMNDLKKVKRAAAMQACVALTLLISVGLGVLGGAVWLVCAILQGFGVI